MINIEENVRNKSLINTTERGKKYFYDKTIATRHLNESKLHLNSQGIQILSNFAEAI